MWNIVSVVAAVVVVILLFEVLDFTDIFKKRLKGGTALGDLSQRVKELEERLSALERKAG